VEIPCRRWGKSYSDGHKRISSFVMRNRIHSIGGF
jgi:hypothetical protein